MLPPSSSSDEGPAPRERNFDARARKNIRYPQERVYGGNGDGDGRDSRGRYSDDDEETGATTATSRCRRRRQPRRQRCFSSAGPAGLFARARSFSLRIRGAWFCSSLAPEDIEQPDQEGTRRPGEFGKWLSVFSPGRRERASPGFVFCRFFLSSSCRKRSIGCASARIVVNSVGSTIQGLARNLLSPFFYQGDQGRRY